MAELKTRKRHRVNSPEPDNDDDHHDAGDNSSIQEHEMDRLDFRVNYKDKLPEATIDRVIELCKASKVEACRDVKRLNRSEGGFLFESAHVQMRGPDDSRMWFNNGNDDGVPSKTNNAETQRAVVFEFIRWLCLADPTLRMEACRGFYMDEKQQLPIVRQSVYVNGRLNPSSAVASVSAAALVASLNANDDTDDDESAIQSIGLAGPWCSRYVKRSEASQPYAWKLFAQLMETLEKTCSPTTGGWWNNRDTIFKCMPQVRLLVNTNDGGETGQTLLGFCVVKDDGAIFMFEILPRWRRRGYGRLFIQRLNEEGYIPYPEEIVADSRGFWNRLVSRPFGIRISL